MRLAVLTTQTTHHSVFIRELNACYNVDLAVVEQGSIKAPFPTRAPFEDQRDIYERECFFGGRDVPITELVPALVVDNINEAKSIEGLQAARPDVVIVFGTRKLGSGILKSCPGGLLNLHGGNPEDYRGLDSHLWAIYHDDFSGLITTLHRVNDKLDDGEIVSQAAVPVFPGMKLHELRRYNTEVCIKMTVSALDMFSRFGEFLARPQSRPGRYYSFMPAPLKQICLEKFEKYTEALDESAFAASGQ